MTMIFVYPEKTRLPASALGSIRFECEWQELTPGGAERYKTERNYEHDRDRDEQNVRSYHDSRDAAIATLKAIVDAGRTVYGCGTVTKQRLEWLVKADGCAEWNDQGDAEYYPDDL